MAGATIAPATIAQRHPEQLSRIFAFVTNSDPSGVADIGNSPVFNAYIARAGEEYEALSPTPSEYKAFTAKVKVTYLGLWMVPERTEDYDRYIARALLCSR